MFGAAKCLINYLTVLNIWIKILKEKINKIESHQQKDSTKSTIPSKIESNLQSNFLDHLEGQIHPAQIFCRKPPKIFPIAQKHQCASQVEL
jgi:hypothetical protein